MTAIAFESSNVFEKHVKAETIGEVREEPARMVRIHTSFGGMIDMLVGDPLPRRS